MKITDREKKIAAVEAHVKKLRTRLKRLNTAYYKAVDLSTYHQRQLSLEQAEELAALRFAVPKTQGRKFR